MQQLTLIDIPAPASPESDEWYSPAWVPAIGLEYWDVPHYDLDPFCPQKGAPWALNHYHTGNNALRSENVFRGLLYSNPPYSHPLLSQAIEKIVTSYQAGMVKGAILLVPMSFCTAWARLLADFPTYTPGGRIECLPGPGNSQSSPRGELRIVGMGIDDLDRWERICQELDPKGPGQVWRRAGS